MECIELEMMGWREMRMVGGVYRIGDDGLGLGLGPPNKTLTLSFSKPLIFIVNSGANHIKNIQTTI